MIGLVHICDINGPVPVGTNGGTEMGPLYQDIACLVLPMNNTTAIENDFSIGRAFDIYFAAGQDVKPGYQVRYDGNTYVVRVVQPFKVPIVGHVRTMCEQEID